MLAERRARCTVHAARYARRSLWAPAESAADADLRRAPTCSPSGAPWPRIPALPLGLIRFSPAPSTLLGLLLLRLRASRPAAAAAIGVEEESLACSPSWRCRSTRDSSSTDSSFSTGRARRPALHSDAVVRACFLAQALLGEFPGWRNGARNGHHRAGRHGVGAVSPAASISRARGRWWANLLLLVAVASPGRSTTGGGAAEGGERATGALPTIAWTLNRRQPCSTPGRSASARFSLRGESRRQFAGAFGAGRGGGSPILIVVTSVIAYLLWYWALKTSRPPRRVRGLHQPATATPHRVFFAHLFLGEQVTAAFLLGAGGGDRGPFLLAQWRSQPDAAEEGR